MGNYQSTCNRDNCGRALIQNFQNAGVYFSRAADCSTFQSVTVVPAVYTSTVTSGSVTVTPSVPATTTEYTMTNTALPAWVMTACTSNGAGSPSQRFASACSCDSITKGTATATAVTVTMTVPAAATET